MSARILIIYSSGRIGDSLLITPTIKSIFDRHQSCQITLYGHKNTLFLYEGNHHIQDRKALSKRKSMIYGRHYFKMYDKAYVFNSLDEQAPSHYISFAKRVSKHVFSYSNDDTQGYVSKNHFVVANRLPFEHVIERFLRLAKADGIHPTTKQITYHVLPYEREAALLQLRDIEGKETPIRIGLQLTSFSTRSFRDWPINHFEELTKRIISEIPNTYIYIFGLHSDVELANRISMINPARIHSLTGMKIRPTAAIMEQLGFYLGVDTGPSHLMSSFNKPMIVLYHCLFPSKIYAPLWSPHFSPVDLVEHDKNCDQNSDMSDIPVDSIFTLIKARLASS
jgi:heptosyltransferase-3